jgi:hypothetical protein
MIVADASRREFNREIRSVFPSVPQFASPSSRHGALADAVHQILIVARRTDQLDGLSDYLTLLVTVRSRERIVDENDAIVSVRNRYAV